MSANTQDRQTNSAGALGTALIRDRRWAGTMSANSEARNAAGARGAAPIRDTRPEGTMAANEPNREDETLEQM